MKLSINTQLLYRAPKPCWVLLQIEAAETTGQQLIAPHLNIAGEAEPRRIASEDGVGERIWLHVEEQLDCTYHTSAQIAHQASALEDLVATPLSDLPAEAIKYLLPSRYCTVFEFDDLLRAEFGGLGGGKQISAMSQWLGQCLTYDPTASDATTSAWQTLQQRRGVCRDFAHVLISLARAAAIPARYVSVYSPDAVPMDFHAMVQVYLDGAWRGVDPSGLSDPKRNAVIGGWSRCNRCLFPDVLWRSSFHQPVGRCAGALSAFLTQPACAARQNG